MSISGRFCIWVVTPPNYIHSQCFEPQARALKEAFAALGYDAPIVTDPAQIQGTAITLGANLLPQYMPTPPDDLIIFNLEQVQENSQWFNPGYIALLKRYPVWDYSELNIAGLKSSYGVDATYCGIGYMPSLTCIPSTAEDIDVLFVGSVSPRRMKVLEAIAKTGLKVSALYNSYGAQRDAVIARAKIIINIHFYEAQVFEITRVSYMLANRKCVVSEPGFDRTLEDPFAQAVAFAPYDKLAETCQHLIAAPAERTQLATRGFECFQAMSQVDMLKHALQAQALPQMKAAL